MKKLLALCLTAVLCLCCLASCGSAHEENKWFSEEKLTQCLVGELPTIEKEYVNHNDEDIYVNFTNSEFEAYAKSVYDYLCSQEYKYLGTRGEQKNTLAGVFTTYYFEPADHLSRFNINGDYIFVFSNDTVEENDNVVFIVLVIYDASTNTLEYGNKKFIYNTQISLRRGSEAPLSGFYELPGKGDHEHILGEWQYDESYHWRSCECTWDMCDVDISGEHYDDDGNSVCDACGYVMPEHKHTYEYNHDDIGHGWSYTCGCMTPPNFAQHFDGDGDGKCDEDSCGYVMPEHKHTGKWYKNETIHFYEYTCGCENQDIAELHLDGDGNGLCDICSYQMVAEGNHFIRNQAGAEWLCEITAEDIAEIKMISGGGGPLPPVSKTYISSSRNDAVISNIFEEYYWLDSKPVSEERTQIADGGYFIVQFILNNGETKQLYFINGDFYHDGNGNYFELVRLPVFRDGTDYVTRYGFERQYDPSQIHLIDETPVCEIPFSEFEFTELTDDIYLDAELPTHYFELHGERVYFIKGEYFYIGDNRSVYYQLIGNLDELIAEYSVIDE